MSRQRGQISIELRKLIIKHTEDRKSVREISEIVKRSYSTVHDIIKSYKTDNQVEKKPKKAHNKIFTEADERYLVRKVKVNPFLSAPKIAIIAENELGKKASPSTIRNVLHKKNLTGRKTRQKPFIRKASYLLPCERIKGVMNAISEFEFSENDLRNYIQDNYGPFEYEDSFLGKKPSECKHECMVCGKKFAMKGFNEGNMALCTLREGVKIRHEYVFLAWIGVCV
ncbi:zinc finger protein [Trichonephila clavata]|uniref:Zinc finger protein n=1 Tax=Trichonephila clavata TaxID=2740835 RepID=A0A8X6H5D2_TRICU|nr:zinc finger protein [Trichonephila clavata]